jgi:hypothetical protein
MRKVSEINKSLSECQKEIRLTQLWSEETPELLVKKMQALLRLHSERSIYVNELYEMI